MCVEHSKCSSMAVKFIIDTTDWEYLKEHEIKQMQIQAPETLILTILYYSYLSTCLCLPPDYEFTV